MNEKLKEFTSKELLSIVRQRQDIYIAGYYDELHVEDLTGLPTKYFKAFMNYTDECGALEEAVEGFIEHLTDGELMNEIITWLEEFVKDDHVRNYIIANTSVMYRDEKSLDNEIGFYVDIRINKYKDWEPIVIIVKQELQEIFSITENTVIDFLQDRMQAIVDEYFNY